MKGMTKYTRERMLLKNTPRRVLTLEERVAAIKFYDRTPVYQQVALTFKCSWEQIKNIILKRESILNYYATCQLVQQNDGKRVERQRKINFLGNVMYEFIKRAYVHGNVQLNDDIIRERALEFRNIIGIDSFYPNKTWVNDFKNVYNVNLQQLDQIVIVKTPLKSLDCKSIVSHCRREVERILQSTIRPKTSKTKTVKAKSKRVTKGDTDNYADDGDCEDVVEMCSESIDDHDNDDHNDVIHEEDEDIDDVVIGNEPSQDLYYGDGDEDINENEDGLTINYGDYEYNEEDDLLMPLFSIKAEKEELANDSINKERIDSDSHIDANLLIPEIALKVEDQALEQATNVRASTSKRRRSNSSVEENKSYTQRRQSFENNSTESKTDTKKADKASKGKHLCSNSRNEQNCNDDKKTNKVDNITNSETETGSTSSPSTTRIMNYTDALNWLRPLQHFAIEEEDFSALNLLLQLSDAYDRALSRKNNG